MAKCKRLTALLAFSLSHAGVLWADDLEFAPYVNIGEIYTDNVALAQDGEERDAFITFVNPGFALRRDRGRVRADVAYQMQNLIRAGDSDGIDTFHQLGGSAVGEILRERLYVDLATSISQQIIDARQAAPLSNRSVSDNRADAIAISVSPYARQELGATAQAMARYRYGLVDFDDGNANDLARNATLNGALLALGSPPGERRLAWLGAYGHERVTFENSDLVDKFEQQGIRLDYSLTRRFDLTALGGYEDNVIAGTASTRDTKGTFWAAGFRWEPTARDLLEARYGERFFGNNYFLLWEHSRRSFATRISYSEDLTTVAQTLLDDTGGLLDYRMLDADARTAPDVAALTIVERVASDVEERLSPPGEAGSESAFDIDSPFDGLSLVSDAFLNKRLDAGIFLHTPNSEASVNLYQEQRDPQQLTVSGRGERARGVQAVLQWRLGPRTDFVVGLDYAHQNFDVDGRSADLNRVVLALQRNIGARTVGRLEAARTQRDSEDNLEEYLEHALTLSIARLF